MCNRPDAGSNRKKAVDRMAGTTTIAISVRITSKGTEISAAAAMTSAEMPLRWAVAIRFVLSHYLFRTAQARQEFQAPEAYRDRPSLVARSGRRVHTSSYLLWRKKKNNDNSGGSNYQVKNSRSFTKCPMHYSRCGHKRCLGVRLLRWLGLLLELLDVHPIS